MGNSTSYVKRRLTLFWDKPLLIEVLTASIVPYRGFKTKDGDIMLGGGNDRLYGVLCERLGRSEWKDDGRFITNADRVKNRTHLEGMIEKRTKERTTQEWLDDFEGSGMPYAPINDIQTALSHDHGMLDKACQKHAQIDDHDLLTPLCPQYETVIWLNRSIIQNAVKSNS